MKSEVIQLMLFAVVSCCAPASGQTLTFTNAAPGGSNEHFFVGDPWILEISGATPNAQVTIAAWFNGQYLGATPLGETDGAGELELEGFMDSWTVGDWVEILSVGGSQLYPTLEFEVEVEACEVSNSGGSFLNLGVTEDWGIGDTSPYLRNPTFLPAMFTHSVISGPCRYSISYHNTYTENIAADFKLMEMEGTGYKEVEWTLDDARNYGSQRCNPTHYICQFMHNYESGYALYTIYDYGSIQTVFTHPYTQQSTFVTTAYQFVIAAIGDTP